MEKCTLHRLAKVDGAKTNEQGEIWGNSIIIVTFTCAMATLQQMVGLDNILPSIETHLEL